jgi:hypothetical protein
MNLTDDQILFRCFHTSVALLLDKRTDMFVLTDPFVFVVDDDDIEWKLDEFDDGKKFEVA